MTYLRPWIVCALLCAAGPLHAQRIGQVLANPPGVDLPNEYVELMGTPTSILSAGTYLVGIEGDATTQLGDVQTIFDLSGLPFGANGQLLLLPADSPFVAEATASVYRGTGRGFAGIGSGFSADAGALDIENASVTFMLIQAGSAPTLATDIDADNNGLPDGSSFASWSILDSVSLLDGGGTDYGYGAIVFRDTAGAGTSFTGTVVDVDFTAGYVARMAGTGTASEDWLGAEVGGSSPESFVLQNSSVPGYEGASFSDVGLSAVPEPAVAAYLGVGLATLCLVGLRARRAPAHS